MRWILSIGLALGTTAATLAQVQPPQGNPPPAAADPLLQPVLQNWQQAMTNVASLDAQVVRTSTDLVFKANEVYEGNARFLKSNVANQPSRASLELKKRGQPDAFEKYICTGNFLYEYAPASKVIRVHQLNNGGLGNDNFLSFIFGMNAQQAQQRYHIVYVPGDPKNVATGYYHYLRILPITQRDKADFTEARLTLLKSNYMPRQLWFLQPNKNEVLWDFPKIAAPANLGPADFGAPQAPPGWQIQQVPANNQPPAASKVRSAGS